MGSWVIRRTRTDTIVGRFGEGGKQQAQEALLAGRYDQYDDVELVYVTEPPVTSPPKPAVDDVADRIMADRTARGER